LATVASDEAVIARAAEVVEEGSPALALTDWTAGQDSERALVATPGESGDDKAIDRLFFVHA
jgi:hypothetical protein